MLVKKLIIRQKELFYRVQSEGDLITYILATFIVVILGFMLSYLFAFSRLNEGGKLELSQSVVENISPLAMFIIGITITLMVGASLFGLMLNRTFRLSERRDAEVKKAKDDMLVIASHQLRTPASGVKQYLGMVLEGYTGKLTREQKSLLQKAYTSNERQIEIVNQLLYVAKADAGELTLNLSNHNLTLLVKNVVEEQLKAAKDKNINLIFKGSRGLKVNVDKRFMTMIIENLLNNAIKYSYENSEINISVSKKQGMVCVNVSDRGVGIKEADIDKLFKKFSRVENELSHYVGGSGVGLYLSQLLAKAHGGIIEVKPRNDGSTFSLVLPIANVTDSLANKKFINLPEGDINVREIIQFK